MVVWGEERRDHGVTAVGSTADHEHRDDLEENYHDQPPNPPHGVVHEVDDEDAEL